MGYHRVVVLVQQVLRRHKEFVQLQVHLVEFVFDRRNGSQGRTLLHHQQRVLWQSAPRYGAVKTGAV